MMTEATIILLIVIGVYLYTRTQKAAKSEKEQAAKQAEPVQEAAESAMKDVTPDAAEVSTPTVEGVTFESKQDSESKSDSEVKLDSEPEPDKAMETEVQAKVRAEVQAEPITKDKQVSEVAQAEEAVETLSVVETQSGSVAEVVDKAEVKTEAKVETAAKVEPAVEIEPEPIAEKTVEPLVEKAVEAPVEQAIEAAVSAEPESSASVEVEPAVSTGSQTQADLSWANPKLTKSISELDVATDAPAEHLAISAAIAECYKQRKQAEYVQYGAGLSQPYLEVFAAFVKGVKAENPDAEVKGTAMMHLSTLLNDNGEFDSAISICKTAIEYGLADGTVTGFEGRITRIEKAKAKASK
ncbi:hypothetical protein [Shewanella pneumatophori]|uniref:Uncharacterized protein n=1 Tax=Shewanella pneumatophori TaxID=314092 RepID=A0A9X1ZFB5_9GAMM|nr:hypothetical protein [Shewanella pneumatophori]MCL1140588.1 hypothetical protein [Shewanella pneumatophori]